MSLYSNDKIRKKAEHLVQNEVYYCVSYLVSQIIQNSATWNAFDLDEDEVYDLAESKDWDEPAEREIDGMDREELMEYLEDQGVEFESDEEVDGVTVEHETIESLREKALAAMRDQGAKDFCEDRRVEPDRNDIYEYWIVSDWFASKLEQEGEVVARDFLGLTIWGRATTGQTISMDGVVLRIAQDLINEYGE